MKRLSSILLCAALATVQLSYLPTVTLAHAANQPTLQDGTPIKLRLGRNLSSADAHTGDTVDFEVVEEVRVNGAVVIPRGSNATATVTNAEAKKRMARGGKLDVNIDSVRLADGEKIPLRGTQGGKGGGHTGAMTGAMVATSLVLWPAAPFFLLMHGKDITIPKGTEITAYTNGDIPIDLARFSGAPATSGSPAMAETSKAAAPPAPATATAAVTSSPAGADVEVDGNYVGSTPSQLQLIPGDHTIAVKKRGYKPWSRTMKVAGGAPLNINADLESARAGH